MKVQEIMTENPACCAPETSIRDAAKLMADHDCGEIPVVDDEQRPVGVVTCRDICCRGLARDKSPETPVRDVMSSSVVTVTPDTSVEDCCKALEDSQIRRVPVVDESGKCCGMVSQADIAQHASEADTAQVVRDVSRPTLGVSLVG